MPAKIFCSGVSKIADFRHVDMEGEMKGERSVWGQYPLKTMLNAAYQKIFKKGFHFASIFTWKGSGEYAAADRRWYRHDPRGDRWLLILVRRYFKKISGRGFQKARFWTLDDDSRAEIFSGGGATLSRFLHRRVAGNMEPLTGGDAGRIRMGDRWLLILVRSDFKKIFESGFQKARFWTFKSGGRKRRWWRMHWKNFLEGVSFCPIFPM